MLNWCTQCWCNFHSFRTDWQSLYLRDRFKMKYLQNPGDIIVGDPWMVDK
jgi:hypothetical protein